MEVIVNNPEILISMVKNGVLAEINNLRFIVNEGAWSDSKKINQIILASYITAGVVVIFKLHAITYGDIFPYIKRYGLLNYMYYDYISIAICKSKGSRLVTNNSAMKTLAKAEGIEIVTPEQIEEIIIRGINYEYSLKGEYKKVR